MIDYVTECECSDEYGPCEDHGTVLAQREGAAVRTADDLAALYLDDALDIAPDCLSPYGQDVRERVAARLEANRSYGVAWLDDPDLADELMTVVHSVETELATLDAPALTWWEDGYVIARVTGGPMADDGSDDGDLSAYAGDAFGRG